MLEVQVGNQPVFHLFAQIELRMTSSMQDIVKWRDKKRFDVFIMNQLLQDLKALMKAFKSYSKASAQWRPVLSLWVAAFAFVSVSYELTPTACYEQPQHGYKSHQDKP